MKKNYALLSIEFTKNKLNAFNWNSLFQAVGKNTGNLLFTTAVAKQIKGGINRIEGGFLNYDTHRVRAENDFLIIPAANWISESVDLDRLALKIEKTDLPVVVLGLGAQSSLTGKIPKLTKGTEKFLKVISDKSSSISVRGSFTAEVLNYYGIKNIQNTGCPSFFYNLSPKLNIDKIFNSKLSIVLNSTRYGLNAESIDSNSKRVKLNNLIYKTSAALNVPIVFQSEVPELSMARKNPNNHSELEKPSNNSEKSTEKLETGKINLLRTLYNTEKAEHHITQKGVYFNNTEDWINFLKTCDLSVGTRLHGTIASLLAGKPAILFSHDSRTKEVIEDFNLPSFFPSKLSVDFIKIEEIYDWYNCLDFKPFEKIYEGKYYKMVDFYKANNVATYL